MVRRLFNLLKREFGGLHEAALLIGAASLASQFLGLWRDRMLAGTFGAGSELDIYYAAFRVPDLVYLTIGSFVSVTVLIPFLIKHIRENDLLGAKKFISGMFTLFCLVMVLLTLALIVLAPWLAKIVAPGFGASDLVTLTGLMRLILVSPFLLGLSNLLGSITQSYRQFLVFALSPVLYNLGIILGVVFGYPLFGLSGLAYGVILGAFLHLLIQVPTVMATGIMPRFGDVNWQEFKQVVSLSLPRTLTLATQQVVFTIFISLASFLDKGSIALFNLSFNIQSVPLAVFGVSYSVAAFPTLAKLFSGGEVRQFVDHVGNGIRQVLFWTIPAACLFIVLRAQIVRVILGAGEFDWTATRLAAASLALFVVSVAGQSIMLLFVRAYYAGGQTRKPLLVNLFSSAVTVGLAFVLLGIFKNNLDVQNFVGTLLRVSDVRGIEMLALPLAFSIGAILNTVIHWLMFKDDFAPFDAKVVKTLWQALAGGLAAGVSAYIILQITADKFSTETILGVFSHGLSAGVVGILAGITTLKALGSEELAAVSDTLHHKFWRAQAVAPGEGEM